MKTTFILVSCLCCFALNPLRGAEEAEGQAAPAPPLTAEEQVAADGLIAAHGKAALLHYLQGRTIVPEARALSAAEYLISKGADVNAKDNAGLTPFDMAVEKNNIEVVDYFDSLP